MTVRAVGCTFLLLACGGEVTPTHDAAAAVDVATVDVATVDAVSDGANDAGPTVSCTPEQPAAWAPLCSSSAVPTRLVSAPVAFATGLVVDRGYLYWTTTPSTPKVALVERVKTNGDELLAVAQIQDDYSDEISLTLNTTFVIVATYNVQNQVFVVPRSCGTPKGVGGFLDVNSQFVVADEGAAYIGTGQLPPYAITAVPLDGGKTHALASSFSQMTFAGAVDATHVFVSTDFGALSAVSLDGGAAALGPSGWPLAIDALSVFAALGDIFSVPKSGGSAKSLVAQTGATSIAVDDVSVYWTDDFGVYKAPKNGGSPQVIAASPEAGIYVAIDDACVYWIGDGGIWTAPK